MEKMVLAEGGKYEFHTKDWVSPFGETVKGRLYLRTFLHYEAIDGHLFLRVGHDDGRSHLISAETIRSAAKIAEGGRGQDSE